MEEEREIDLERYLRIWLRFWYIPIAFACVGILVAFLLVLGRPQTSRARVLFAVTWGAPGTLGTEPQAAPATADAASRKQLLASIRELATSSVVAQAVLDSMGAQLPEDQRSVAALLTRVDSQLIGGSDLIAVTVRSTHPDTALALAHAWSEAYIQQVDELYSTTNQRLLQALQVQLANAQGRYNRSQTAWQDTLRGDRQAELQRELDERKSLANSLSAARQAVLPTLLGEIARLESVLADAQDLRSQIQAGGSVSGHMHVLALLEVRAADSGSSTLDVQIPEPGQTSQRIAQPQTAPVLTLQLQADPTLMTVAEMNRDLDSLIDIVEARLGRYHENLRKLSESLTQGQSSQALYLSRQGPATADPQSGLDMTDAMARLDQDIRALQAAMEQEKAKVQAAKMEYDLASKRYEDLALAESELTVKEAITAGSVQLAAPAMILRESTNRLAFLGTGGLLGLVLGALTAVIIDAKQQGVASQSELHSEKAGQEAQT